MANFSTKYDNGAPNGTPRKDIGSTGAESRLMMHNEGRKQLLGSANNIELAFNQIYITGLTGRVRLSTEAGQEIEVLSDHNLTLQSGSNENIIFKRSNTVLSEFARDAYQSVDGQGQAQQGSGHPAFLIGVDETQTVDSDASYLTNNNAATQIDVSIGKPGTAKNLYVGGALEVDGHFQADGTAEFDGVVTFDGTPVFNDGATFQTGGTLGLTADVAFTTAGSFAITSGTTSTSITTGAAIITGGVGISENLNVGGNVTITGNLQVLGTTTSVETATLQVEDNIIELGKTSAAPNADTAYDLGIRAQYYKGSLKNIFFGYDSSEERFVFYDEMDANEGGPGAPDSLISNGVLGDVSFGKIFTNQLTSGSFPLYTADGLDEQQVTSGNGTATLMGADISGGQGGSFVKVFSEVAATSKTTGAFQVAGGVGVGGDLYASNIFTDGNITANLAANRLIFTGANGLLSVNDVFQVSQMNTGGGQHGRISIQDADAVNGPTVYAEFDGATKQLTVSNLRVSTLTQGGGIAFSNNQGVIEEDARFTFNDANNAAVFTVQTTANAKIMEVTEADQFVMAANLKVTALNTNGGIAFSDAAGVLNDDGALLWDGSKVDITGGLSATTNIELDGGGDQFIKMDRQSGDDLIIQRVGDNAGGKIFIEATTKTDDGASAGPSISLHAKKDAGHGNVNSDNIGKITLRSDKTGNNVSAVEIFASGGAVEVSSQLGVLLDDLTIKTDNTANAYHTANIKCEMKAGALGSDVLVMSLIDAYRHAPTEANFIGAAEPVALAEFGFGIKAKAANSKPTWDYAATKSEGILHSSMSSAGGGVEMPELYWNGEMIVSWNGSAYSLAGASLMAGYLESVASNHNPHITINANGGEDLDIRVNATAGFVVDVGPGANDIHLKALGDTLQLGAQAVDLLMEGHIKSSITLKDDGTAKAIGYSASPGNQNPVAGPLTIRGQSTGNNVGGDIYLKAGKGQSAAQEIQSGVVFDQTDNSYVGWKQNYTERPGIKVGYVLDATFSPADADSENSFKGISGIAQFATQGGNAKMGEVAMAGTICWVAENGTNLSNDGSNNPRPAGIRVYLHPDDPGAVTHAPPVAHGQRVVQVGYLVDASAPITLDGESLVKIIFLPQDEGTLFLQ